MAQAANIPQTAGMEITPEQFAKIEHCLPTQRGNVSLSNLQVLNAILYVAEHGCKWRGLPKRFGNWHTIYTRMNRWSKVGVLDRMFEELQQAQIVRIKIEAVSLDSHQHQGASRRHRGAKKNGPQAIGKSRGGWNTKIHMVAADARTAITFSLSPGQAHDAPEGRALLQPPGRAESAAAPAHGSRLRGRRDTATGARSGFHSRGAAAEPRGSSLGVRPRDVQAAQRDRTAVPPPQGLSPHLLALREARRDVPRLHQLRR